LSLFLAILFLLTGADSYRYKSIPGYLACYIFFT